MADTMQFDLVSPERRLASLEVTAVQIPGADGDMTAMPNHAPLITTLRPGILRIDSAQGEQEFVVTGGFAELGENLSILAEKAVAKGDLDQATYDAMLSEANAAHDAAKSSGIAIDDTAKTVADLQVLGSEIGLA